MIPGISSCVDWLTRQPRILQGIGRGIERETLRVTPDGKLSCTPHPAQFGAALTHPWITTDFAEAMLEFITPVDGDIRHMLTFLRDIHRHTARQLARQGDEYMWPLSMPCQSASNDIILAQYGHSNIGRFKTLYRQGLKNRYGALMQLISGVHYNFSLPLAFWQAKYAFTDSNTPHARQLISSGYLHLIRNYYRFGWIIPYLFGASPAVCASFLQGKTSTLPFEKTADGKLCYLPWATSLRLSDLGYTNTSQNQLVISFNDLAGYVQGLKQAIKTPCAAYQRIGLLKNSQYQQINTNILQIENEFYAPVRPKRVSQPGESPADALSRAGIEYIEVRSLDINPFSTIGVDEQQVHFLDLFLIWCALADSPTMSNDELLCTRENWNRVILQGRKPGLLLSVGCETARYPLDEAGTALFSALGQLAKILDSINSDNQYQQVCEQLLPCFAQPELTLSARVLQNRMMENGMQLAQQYRQQLSGEALEILTDDDFDKQRQCALQRQQELEMQSAPPFDQWLQSQQ